MAKPPVPDASAAPRRRRSLRSFLYASWQGQRLENWGEGLADLLLRIAFAVLVGVLGYIVIGIGGDWILFAFGR